VQYGDELRLLANERIRTVKSLKPGGAIVVALLSLSVMANAAAAAEVENPRFVPPYPKAFHLGNASQRTSGEGIVPISFAAKEPEGAGTEIVLTCNTFKGDGQVTGPKTLTTTLVLSGCHSNSTPAAKCSNSEKAGEIVATPSTGELGRIDASSNSVGLRLEFNLEAVCKSRTSTYPLSIKGSAIGVIKPVNTKSNRFTIKFTRSGYEQVPAMFEGGPPTVLVSTVGVNPPQPTAVQTTMFVKFPTPTEIKP
jgi:hypothetical protein